MLAVPLPEAEVAAPLLGAGLSLAAVNGPSLCVVAGAQEAIAALEAELAARGRHAAGGCAIAHAVPLGR